VAIINEVRAISRVVYDITSKRPGHGRMGVMVRPVMDVGF
jgi:hypothetical protein